MVQRHLFSWILDPLCRLLGGIRERRKSALFMIGGAIVMLLSFRAGAIEEGGRYIVTFMVGCFAQGLMILGALPGKMSALKVDKSLLLLWMGTGFLMLWPAIRYNADFFSEAIIFLIAMPITWLVWGQKDYLWIFQRICCLSRWALFAFFLISGLFFPVKGAQYPGMFLNVNGTGMLLTALFCPLLGEVFSEQLPRRVWVSDVVLLGICAALMYYTNSRTGELALLVVFTMAVLVAIVSYKKNAGRILLHTVLPVVLSVMICIPVTLYLLRAVYIIGAVVQEAVLGENIFIDMHSGLLEFIQKNADKSGFGGKTLDQYSTGRISIWKEFARHISLFGTRAELPYYIPELDKYYGTAHNVFLGMAVDYGVFCSAAFFVFCIIAGLKAIPFAVKNPHCGYAMMPLLMILGYGVQAMLGSISTPYSYIPTMYFYFLLEPLIFRHQVQHSCSEICSDKNR